MDIQRAFLHTILPSSNKFKKYDELPNWLTAKKELGGFGVWTLNSAKQGNGIVQLRDNSAETFWQSDGPIPHLVDLHFPKKTRVSEIALYLDYKTDESYTPEVISIKGGLHLNAMQEITRVSLLEPTKWHVVYLKHQDAEGKSQDYVYTLNLQIAVLQMHHSGKDTHIRQVKVFGPVNNQNAKSRNSKVKFNDVWQYLR